MPIFPIGPFRKASVGFVPPMPFRDHLELWLDARILSGADGTNVNLWPDQSRHHWDMPSGINVVQKPTLRTTGSTAPTGQQTVEFLPKTDTTSTTGPYFWRSNVDPGFATIPDTSLGTTFYVWGDVSRNTVSALMNIWVVSGEQNEWKMSGVGAQAVSITPPTDGDIWDGPSNLGYSGVTSFVRNPPNNGTGVCNVYINGVQRSLLVGDGLWAASQPAGTATVIALSDHNAANVGAHPIHGQIGVILWYSIAHTAAQRGMMERWIRSIWG